MTLPDLHATLCSVGTLFAGKDTYRVPIYQRNYAWEARQIEQLLDDITDAKDDAEDCIGDSSYFLGNLVVTAAPDSAGETVYDVVDGQQRLTTLYLLLSALSSPSSSRGVPPSALSYESRPRAAAALRTAGPYDRGCGTDPVNGDDADAGIAEGLNVVHQYLERRRLTGGDRDELDHYLRQNVKVARTILPMGTDLNRYFEVMNTRGQQLEQVDIVKARLMSQLSESPTDMAAFARIWDACADMDTYVQMALTPENPSLRGTLFGESWTWLEVHDWATLSSALMTGSSTSAETTEAMSLDQAIDRYAAFTGERRQDDEDTTRFQSPIEFPTFLLHALKVVGPTTAADPADDQRLLDDKKLIERFDRAFKGAGAEVVTRFAVSLLDLRNRFDAFVLKREYTARTGEDGDWSLQRLVKQTSGRKTTAGYRSTFPLDDQGVESEDVDTSTRTLLLLESMLRTTYTSPRTMHWITVLLDYIRSAHPSDMTSGGLEDLLEQYARDQVQDAFPHDDEPTGFDIHRIVFTYLDYLLLQEPGTEIPGYRFTFRNSIEHFYPQRPDQDQHGAAVSAGKRDRLGNLALVSVRSNSKFSNSLPQVKATNFSRTLEQSPKLKEMGRLADAGSWDDTAVDEHHARMVQLIRRDRALGTSGSKRPQ